MRFEADRFINKAVTRGCRLITNVPLVHINIFSRQPNGLEESTTQIKSNHCCPRKNLKTRFIRLNCLIWHSPLIWSVFKFHFHLRTREMGVSLQASHPHDSSSSYRDLIRRSERPGQAHTRSVAQKLVLWASCHICKNEVSFDVAQDREPVERPFLHLRTNGVSLKRDSHFPYTQHRFWTRVKSNIVWRCSQLPVRMDWATCSYRIVATSALWVEPVYFPLGG